MLRDIAIKQDDRLSEVTDLGELGRAANHFASRAAFENYRARKSPSTIKRQDNDLALFGEFLRSIGAEPGELGTDPDAWKGVSWGLVAAFQGWLLGKGYAIGSVNVRLSTVKTYSKLAFLAGSLAAEEFALIKGIEGYSHKEQRRIDDRRRNQGVATRTGSKKSTSTRITKRQADALKRQPDTPQGRRDAVMMALLIDFGLRVGELAGLWVENFDLEADPPRFRVYRPKVDRWQTFRLTGDTLRAVDVYMSHDADKSGPLLKGSNNRGDLTGPLSEKSAVRAINKRVELLGRGVGLDKLSPHDCRHYAATQQARKKTLRDLMDFFGWSSPSMAARYVESETELGTD